MPTQATVIKNALRLLGEPSNVGIDSDKKIVREIMGAWEDVAGRLFESHPWNAFKSVAQLTQVTPAVLGWEYTFNQPANCKRVIFVSDVLNEDGYPIEYTWHAGKILSNHETTYCWFVDGAYIEQVGGWPSTFADLHAAHLASEVYPVNDESDNTRSRIDTAIVDRGNAARAFDGSTDPIVRSKPGEYLRSRRGWRPGGWRG
jgi:hypothetical protein